MSRSAEDIFLSRFRDYDNLLTMLYESDKPEIVSNRVNKGLRNLKRQLKENSDELLSLESYVNSCRNNLINDFRNSYPQCTNRALTFFLYKCLGLSDKSITVVTDNKITNIYNWKYRLKNMISQSDIPTANKDRFIKELCR